LFYFSQVGGWVVGGGVLSEEVFKVSAMIINDRT
jgi:hypothetical protein